MNQVDEAAIENYPHGRGYGHDYMRGGEVLGGYGYAERDEYTKIRGALTGHEFIDSESGMQAGSASQADTQT